MVGSLLPYRWLSPAIRPISMPLNAPKFKRIGLGHNYSTLLFIDWGSVGFLSDQFDSSEDPTSIQNPYWLNDSCSPYTSESAKCTLGNIVDYTIDVSSAADVVAGVKFAQDKNIRLVIKNTGHEYVADPCM